MRLMYRNKLAALAVFFALTVLSVKVAYSQFSMSNPYSRYGIGSMYGVASQTGSAMGGVGYALARNNDINILNPASYSAIDTQSFVFNIGFDLSWNRLQTSNDKSKSFLASVQNISFAFPVMRRLKVGLSLMPVSDVDYKATDTVFAVPVYTKKYTGEGNVDKFTAGIAYEILSNERNHLSVGFNADYHFGTITRKTAMDFYATVKDTNNKWQDTAGFFNNQTVNRIKVSSFMFDIGVQYFYRTTDGDMLGLGLSFTPSVKLNTETEQKFYTYYNKSGVNDTVNTISDKNIDGHIKMPMRIGGGVSFERPGRLFAEADITYTKWSQFEFADPQNMKDNVVFNAGAEYIPYRNSTNYFSKLAYRFGINYDNGYIYLADKRIDKFGISFGTALPIKKLGTKVNLGFECGRMGTTQNNLIRNNYYKLSISITAKDRWFVQRRYK